MDKQALIDAILEKEWPMFHNVNGEERTDCQNDFPVFQIMRRAQYKAWSAEALEAYLADITAAEAEGRNLAREKYIRMMESTDPRLYETFRGELPEVSEEKRALCEAIWAKMLVRQAPARRGGADRLGLHRDLSEKRASDLLRGHPPGASRQHRGAGGRGEGLRLYGAGEHRSGSGLAHDGRGREGHGRADPEGDEHRDRRRRMLLLRPGRVTDGIQKTGGPLFKCGPPNLLLAFFRAGAYNAWHIAFWNEGISRETT